MTTPTVLAVVPARGGSKGIPRKNVREVAGRPLIAWTIEAALKCPRVSRTVVSTEDEEIARVAKRWGADVPFLRPAELARDDTPGIEPLLHAVETLAARGEEYDFACLLQPTSPLREPWDVSAAVALALEKDADGVVSVGPVRHHPFWMKTLDADGRLTPFIDPGRAYTRRQDLPPVWSLNGAIYLAKTRVLRERRTLYTDRTFGYAMPAERSWDVDSPDDLAIVEPLLRRRSG